MKIICPEKTYEQALIECGMETLENRREKMCIKLINDMKDVIRKLNELLPPTVGHVRERDTKKHNVLHSSPASRPRMTPAPVPPPPASPPPPALILPGSRPLSPSTIYEVTT